MKKRHAFHIRQGLAFADLVVGNPTLAEWAPSVLTHLGWKAYVHRMSKTYGFDYPDPIVMSLT